MMMMMMMMMMADCGTTGANILLSVPMLRGLLPPEEISVRSNYVSLTYNICHFSYYI